MEPEILLYNQFSGYADVARSVDHILNSKALEEKYDLTRYTANY